MAKDHGHRVNNDKPTKITPYRNGPYLVRGPFAIVDQDGKEIEIKRRVVALCRCGRSRIRPFCDGTHKTIGFQAESGLPMEIDKAGVSATQLTQRGRGAAEPLPAVGDTAP